MERSVEAPKERRRSRAIITLIGVLKLVKAAVLILLGIGAVSLIGDPDVRGHVGHWMSSFGVDPHAKYLSELLERLGAVDGHRFRQIGIGLFVYASVFATEGIGLLLRKVWAEVLTVVITTSFIPLEVYEMVEHKSVVKGVVIGLNIAVVVYLVLRLRQEKIWPFKRHRT